MAWHFPKAGQKLSVPQLVEELSRVVDREKISPVALQRIAEKLDDPEASARDGAVEVLPYRQDLFLEDTVIRELCKDGQWHGCGDSGVWKDVNQATARLLFLLYDSRDAQTPAIAPEDFTASLLRHALQSGMILSKEDATKITSAFVQEDDRSDGKISGRKMLTGQADFLRQLFSDWIDPKSYLLLRPKFSKSEQGKLIEAVHAVFREKFHQARKLLELQERETAIANGLAQTGSQPFAQATMIDPNAIALLAQINFQLLALPPNLAQEARELTRNLSEVLYRLSQNRISGDQALEALNNVGRWRFALTQLSRPASGVAVDPAILRGVFAETSNALKGILDSGIAVRQEGTPAVAAFRDALQKSKELRPLATSAATVARESAAGRAWQSAGASTPVSSLVQFAPGNPYRTAIIAGAILLAAGVTVYYLATDEE